MHSSENAYSILARVLMLNAASELRVKYIKDMPYDDYEESRRGKNDHSFLSNNRTPIQQRAHIYDIEIVNI